MIAIVHSIYSQSVHAPALDAGLMDNDAERYCMCLYHNVSFCKIFKFDSVAIKHPIYLSIYLSVA